MFFCYGEITDLLRKEEVGGDYVKVYCWLET